MFTKVILESGSTPYTSVDEPRHPCRMVTRIDIHLPDGLGESAAPEDPTKAVEP